MQYRIGDRDPTTGLYNVIHPDGNQTLNGIKIFNAEHQTGDVVRMTRRSDGMMILDGLKAVVPPVAVVTELEIQKFAEPPVGYLNGQVFNNESETVLPVVSLKFAPNSPEELEVGMGLFRLRISILRPSRKDLSVRFELSGTATEDNYTITGSGLIPAGSLYSDILITPTKNLTGVVLTIITKLTKTRDYRIGSENTVTAEIKKTYYIHKQYVVKDIMRELFYQTAVDEWYPYHYATLNGGEPTVLLPPVMYLGDELARNVRRQADDFLYREFVERIITIVYTKPTNSDTAPSWASTDQSPDLDLEIYRYLTGLSTAPDGTPCPPTYQPSYPLASTGVLTDSQSYTTGEEGLGDVPAPQTIFGRSTCWLYIFQPASSNSYSWQPRATRSYNTFTKIE